jgi:formylglycine-generating enzyme required for sulfatase activity
MSRLRHQVRYAVTMALAIGALIAAAGTLSRAAAAEAATAAGGRPAWASAAGTDTYGRWADLEVNGVSARLRWIAPGSFTMGSPESEPERDADERQHPVTLSHGFWLGDSEVTQAWWQAVLAPTPSRVKGDGQQPIETVSFNDCQRFLARLNELKPGLGALLPSEAQWEYACRAGTTTATYAPLETAAWYSGTGNDLHAVKQKQPNAWGLFDMLGNAWEPCRDWYGPYPSGPVSDPPGPPAGTMHVSRGGSYNSAAGACRAAWRWGESPVNIRHNLGLRVCVPSP